MGECSVPGCEGDENLSFTCNECGLTFCSKHRLPENHYCSTLRKSKSGDSPVFSTGLQDKKDKKRGFTRRSTNRRDQSNEQSNSPKKRQNEDIDSTRDSSNPKNKPSDTGKRKTASRSSSEPDSLSKRSKTVDYDGSPYNPLSSDSGENYYANRPILTTLSKVIRTAVFIGLILGIVGGGILWAGGGGIPTSDDASSALAWLSNATDNVTGAISSSDTSNLLASSKVNQTELQHEIHSEVNEVRTNYSLSKLRLDPQLNDIAEYHSEDMVKNGYYSHTSPNGETMGDRYEKFNYRCRIPITDNRYMTGAENINRVYWNTNTNSYDSIKNESKLASLVVSQWMESPGHRRNILQPEWENEGIGVAVNETSDGDTVVYATQNFC